MDIKSILNFPLIYNWFQRLTGAEKFRHKIVTEYIRAEPGNRILDIGCGTAEILRFLPEVEYYGLDCSEKYITDARKQFGTRGKFECKRVADSNLPAEGYFDIVLAIGILHHLDDAEAEKLFQLAARALKPSGRLLTFDGVYTPRQDRIAQWIISHDLGKYIRYAEDYRRLATSTFGDVNVSIQRNMLNVPYTHAIMNCRKLAETAVCSESSIS